MSQAALGLLQQVVARRLDGDAAAWWQQALKEVQDAQGADTRALFRHISVAARKLGKAPLKLNPPTIEAARMARPGWNPACWRVDEAARVALLLASSSDPEAFSRRLDALCATADMDELVAFYRGLPLYPDPPRHRARAAEGLRSNMKAVFEAVAHGNPYASEQLDEGAWNQMVLKALFVGSALAPIVGLDERANLRLARMLTDYARERRAARRATSPELWRCVGPFAAGPLLKDLDLVLREGSEPEREAVRQALRRSPDPAAQALLETA